MVDIVFAIRSHGFERVHLQDEMDTKKMQACAREECFHSCFLNLYMFSFFTFSPFSALGNLLKACLHTLRKLPQQMPASTIDGGFIVFVLDFVRAIQSLWALTNADQHKHRANIRSILAIVLALALSLRKQDNQLAVIIAHPVRVEDVSVVCGEHQLMET